MWCLFQRALPLTFSYYLCFSNSLSPYQTGRLCSFCWIFSVIMITSRPTASVCCTRGQDCCDSGRPCLSPPPLLAPWLLGAFVSWVAISNDPISKRQISRQSLHCRFESRNIPLSRHGETKSSVLRENFPVITFLFPFPWHERMFTVQTTRTESSSHLIISDVMPVCSTALQGIN